MSIFDPFAVGSYLVVPYRPFVGNQAKNARILDECVKHPERFTLPMARADIMTTAAWYLTDPNNLAWEVWNGSEILGIFLLDRIVPGVDARWHFVFFDGNLTGKQALLFAFLERAFAVPLERISLEVPENVASLISFVRRKLGFQYEGGDRKGSRREHSHYDGVRWHDVVLLRLLRKDYQCPSLPLSVPPSLEPVGISPVPSSIAQVAPPSLETSKV